MNAYFVCTHQRLTQHESLMCICLSLVSSVEWSTAREMAGEHDYNSPGLIIFTLACIPGRLTAGKKPLIRNLLK